MISVSGQTCLKTQSTTLFLFSQFSCINKYQSDNIYKTYAMKIDVHHFQPSSSICPQNFNLHNEFKHENLMMKVYSKFPQGVMYHSLLKQSRTKSGKMELGVRWTNKIKSLAYLKQVDFQVRLRAASQKHNEFSSIKLNQKKKGEQKYK